MTPMVDLAFLLLTFFMLTTTFAKPNVMELQMPVPSEHHTEIRESGAMTILLGKNHRVHYYFGLNTTDEPATLSSTNFSAKGIRQVILERQRRASFVALIKPGPDAGTGTWWTFWTR